MIAILLIAPCVNATCEVLLPQTKTSHEAGTSSRCNTIQYCLFRDLTAADAEYGGAVGWNFDVSDNQITNTSFLKCQNPSSGNNVNRYGGACALNVRGVMIARCCTPSCHSRWGQALWFGRLAKPTVTDISLYLCGEGLTTQAWTSANGAVQFNEGTAGDGHHCNWTDCMLKIADNNGAAVYFWLTNSNLNTEIGCSKFTFCTFSGVVGSMGVYGGKSGARNMVIEDSNFVKNRCIAIWSEEGSITVSAVISKRIWIEKDELHMLWTDGMSTEGSMLRRASSIFHSTRFSKTMQNSR
jgi:hypothetical protein